MEIVRNELVVTLEIVIGDVEENCSVNAFRALLEDFDGELVPAKQRRKQRSDERLFENVGERLSSRRSGIRLGTKR